MICMTEISATDIILCRQLRLIADAGIKDVVITTGYFDDVLEDILSLDKSCKGIDLY